MRTDSILGGFRERRLPINADYRPMYKIGLIVSILSKVCIGNKASLNKLHFFVWALKSERNRIFVREFLQSGNILGLVSWGVEPALIKALKLCIGEGLITLSDDKYMLTDSGENLTKKIDSDDELFIEEKQFLTNIGKRKVTEAFINQLTAKIAN